MSSLLHLDRALLDELARRAAAHPRRRCMHLLHTSPRDVQRMLNALQPGTYVRPHRHLARGERSGFELLMVLRGELGVLLFDEQGQLTGTTRARAGGECVGLELPGGSFHSLVALAPDTILLEVKEGPYEPQADKQFLPSFPEEGTPEAEALEARWRALFLTPA